MSVGQMVKELRKKKGVSQTELADAIGVDRPAISNWERGATSPQSDNLQKLSEYFGVSISAFYNSKDDLEEFNVGEAIRDIRSISEVTLAAVAELLAKATGQSAVVVKNQLEELVKKRKGSSEPNT